MRLKSKSRVPNIVSSFQKIKRAIYPKDDFARGTTLICALVASTGATPIFIRGQVHKSTFMGFAPTSLSLVFVSFLLLLPLHLRLTILY